MRGGTGIFPSGWGTKIKQPISYRKEITSKKQFKVKMGGFEGIFQGDLEYLPGSNT